MNTLDAEIKKDIKGLYTSYGLETLDIITNKYTDRVGHLYQDADPISYIHELFFNTIENL